jgi:hypothetical protein
MFFILINISIVSAANTIRHTGLVLCEGVRLKTTDVKPCTKLVKKQKRSSCIAALLLQNPCLLLPLPLSRRFALKALLTV